jgi:hypothetical protein
VRGGGVVGCCAWRQQPRPGLGCAAWMVRDGCCVKTKVRCSRSRVYILAFLLCCICPPLEGVRSAVVGYSYGHDMADSGALMIMHHGRMHEHYYLLFSIV